MSTRRTSDAEDTTPPLSQDAWNEIFAESQSFSSPRTKGEERAPHPQEAWEEYIQESQVFSSPITTTTAAARDPNSTRFVLMSDTHGRHQSIQVPEGDILIHGGDFSRQGEYETVVNLSAFFQKQQERFEEIIVIAGNHDLSFHEDYFRTNWSRFYEEQPDQDAATHRAALQHCTYLEDSSLILQRSQGQTISVYGSPWTPEFFNWAYNKPRGVELKEIWSAIPTETDVLITHGPPLGRGDEVKPRGHVGCLDLLQEVQNRVKPRLHVFGHIHEGYGVSFDGTTIFANASNVNLRYQPVNDCIVVDLPHDRSQPARVVIEK